MSKSKKDMSQTKENNLVVVIVVALVLCICAGVFIWAAGPKDTHTTTTGDGTSSTISATDSSAQQSTTLDTSVAYYADIDIKDYGKITVKLDPLSAPITCENFIKLANNKFYNGLAFHRIIEDFMMQGGDPLGNGTGGSDQKIVGEFASNGHNNKLSHTRGAISMARSSHPDSASSQFFIVHKDSPHLDGDYAVFGYVTEGMDIVDRVCTDAEPIDSNGTIPASKQPIINSITIRTE